MMKRSVHVPIRRLAMLSLAGCSGSFYARSPDDYRTATRALLESKESSFQQCYQDVLTARRTPPGRWPFLRARGEDREDPDAGELAGEHGT